MSLTISQIRTRVYTKLAAELATPSYEDIHNDSITTWADQAASIVIHTLPPENFPRLRVIDYSVTLSGGNGSITAINVELPLAVKVGTSKLATEMYQDPDDFNRWDSRNFILTPTTRQPVSLVANGRIYVKPTSYTQAYFDYLNKQPGLASNSTYFNSAGDEMLVNIVSSMAFGYLEEYDLQKAYLILAGVAK